MENKELDKYFNDIEKGVLSAYELANKAKKSNLDSSLFVDIPLAKNMAEKIVGLVSVVAPQIKGSGIVERIIEIEDKYGKLDWRVALTIAEEVAREKFCKFKDKIEALEIAIRIGIAYITIGSVASPLEGFVKLVLKKRKDGQDYFCAYFSGPIRSAGGTAASVSVIIIDYLRKKFGYLPYDPTDEEIKRMIVEMEDYHERVTNLQYFPSEEESYFFLKNLPIQIDGDPSEEIEVSNYKDLPRIETNRIRNGPCLVVGEGLTQKAQKLWKNLSKWGKDFDLEHWNFLEEFLEIQKKSRSKGNILQGNNLINPNYTYISDLVGGRPVLTYPLRIGGFRLRYGRGRNSGLSSMCIHPATMGVLDDYIAIGTQLKVERPGKSTAISVCDSIEGPIVKLNNGDVLFLDSEEEARKYTNNIKTILFLGDILVNYGDFLNRAHPLVPVGYCEEWWLQHLKKADAQIKINAYKVKFDDALDLSKKHNVPLHPRYTYHWKDISIEQFKILLDSLSKSKINPDKIILLLDNSKKVLEELGVPHKVSNGEVIIENDWAKALLFSLGIKNKVNEVEFSSDDVLSLVNKLCSVKIMDKSGTYIGARMGRPEKAKMRKLIGSPHALFPVGDEGGRMRSFQAALVNGKVCADFPMFFCNNCKKETIYNLCETCDKITTKINYCNNCKKIVEDINGHKEHIVVNYDFEEIDIKHYFEKALKKLKLEESPSLVKGVRGTANKEHIPEHLCKGILRSIYNLYVNKDGTIRYDMIELPITAFKPHEIGTSIEKLRELGYTTDIYGYNLEREDQVIELKPQDVILPSCDISSEEGADIVLFRETKFLDDLLSKFYSVETFYKLKDKEGLIGHLVVALAPHISVGVIGRIIGFSKTQGFYAHPLFHCACRRDCDGDELSISLLMDVLLNFSRTYLSSHRGAVQDAPLVLTSTLIPSEVDDMVFDLDVASEYPLDLYEAALNYQQPSVVKIEKVKDRLGGEKAYYNYGFTHDTTNINEGVRCSAYKSLPTMEEKVIGQMDIAEKIRAVDKEDVARLIIERHFLRDINGNLRKFSTQEFRCVKCNEKFRRPPLLGMCTKCGGKIIFTVSEGGIVKYLKPSISLSQKYDLPPFLKQVLELTRRKIEGIFGGEKEKQEGLGKWFG